MHISEWGDECCYFSDEDEENMSSREEEDNVCSSPRGCERVATQCLNESCRESVQLSNCSCIRHKLWWHNPRRRGGCTDTQHEENTTHLSTCFCTHGKNEENDQGEKEYAEMSRSIRGGIPVSVLMMHYPLSFCDVDLPFTLELKRTWREIGSLAFWTLSSAKDGNGIRELRDNNASTFWQSDSLSPHTITLHFSQTLPIARVDLLINLQQDESYTPTVVQIKIGSSPSMLSVVREVENPMGDDKCCWWGIELKPSTALKLANGIDDGDALDSEMKDVFRGLDANEYLWGSCLQIAVLATYHQGRDTHIRQVRVYGPSAEVADEEADPKAGTHRTVSDVQDGVYAVDFSSCDGRESLGHSFLETPQAYPPSISEDFFAHIVSAGTFTHSAPEGTASLVTSEAPDFQNDGSSAGSGARWPYLMTETRSVSSVGQGSLQQSPEVELYMRPDGNDSGL